MKFIVTVGGVISGTGKGVSSASIGLLLKLRGLNVQLIKFDPYLNINAGLINPMGHGENFVLDDGTETDLDLGTYERTTGLSMSQKNICTSGTLYKEIIEEQERGDYLGQTVQMCVHLTDKIQKRLINLAKDCDIVIVEIGGTVGDIESSIFFESIRQLKNKYKDDVLITMVAPILWVPTISEFKTKPLQNSIRELQRYGLNPDILLCRTDRDVPQKILEKISKLVNLPIEGIFEAKDVESIYEVPVAFYNRHVDDYIVDMLRLKRTSCKIHKYKELIDKKIEISIDIGICGKYSNHHEAYLSLKEAVNHASLYFNTKVNIRWIGAQGLNKNNVKESLKGLSGLIIPGGFDSTGVEGKILAINYARVNKVPFLGICLGLQCAVIEFARNVCGIKNANSEEFDADTESPVVHYLDGQKDIKIKSASMRLGSYDCELDKDSISYNLYNKKIISERHRHRLEVNSKYLEDFSNKGFFVKGKNPNSNLVEIMEIDKKLHPFFIGTQAHPEFKSNLWSPSPLFKGFVEACIKKHKRGKK